MRNIFLYVIIQICICSNLFAQHIVVSDNNDIVISSGTHFVFPGDWKTNDNVEIKLFENLQIKGGLTHLCFSSPLFHSDGTGKVIFNGSASQAIQSNSELFFPSLAFDNVNGFSINNDALVGGSLEFTNGFVNNVNNSITLGNVISETEGTLSRTNGYMNGTLKKVVSTTSKSSTYLFPVGVALSYNPVTIEFTSGPETSGGLLSVFFNTTIDENYYGNLPIYDDAQVINNISDMGFWEIGSAGLAGNIGYTLTLQGSNFTEGDDRWISEPNELRIVRRDDSSSNWEIAGTFSSASASPPLITVTGIGDAFGQFAMGGEYAVNPLPIELISFKATCSDEGVILIWATASERNNEQFVVEKSFCLNNWKHVASLEGKGNTTSISNYQYVDNEMISETTYYRLKQLDFDGKETKYAPVVVNCGSFSNGLIINAVNYNNGSFLVDFNSTCPNINLQIIALDGKPVFANNIVADNINNRYSEILKILPGVYLLKLSNSKEIAVKKFIAF